MCDRKSNKNNKGDEDMAIVKDNVTSRLSELKKRASKRKNNSDLSYSENNKTRDILNENADLLYQTQMDTLNDK